MKQALYLLLALMVAGPAFSECLDPIELTSGYSEYFRVGSPPGSNATTEPSSLSVSFEPDATGSETTAVLGLQMCSRQSTDSCLDYDWDSDGDGIADTNLLDGSKTEKAGVKNIIGFIWLRIFASTDPSGTDLPEFTVCRRRS